jgi:hypothetical protein
MVYIGWLAVILLGCNFFITIFKKLKKKFDDKKEIEQREYERMREYLGWEIGDLLQISPDSLGNEFIEANCHPQSGALFAALAKWNNKECEATFNNGLSIILDLREVLSNYSYKARSKKQEMIEYMEKAKNKSYEELFDFYQKQTGFVYENSNSLLPMPMQEFKLNSVFNKEQRPEEIIIMGIYLIDMTTKEIELIKELAVSFENFELAGYLSDYLKIIQKS